ncbi:MAG: hypothetical protein EOM12_11495 [Verrucomicrobiae bacterium]|nr:hypothetical protein [Verrucomicrobiae bacterium]
MRRVSFFGGLLLGLFVVAGDRAAATNNVAAPAAVTSAEDSQDYDVKRFLEEAPQLRKVVYGIDASTFLKVGESEEDAALKKGQFVHYEGAWQPDTFYNRILDDMPGREFSNQPKGAVAGSSSDGLFWSLGYNLKEGVISSASEEDSTALKSHSGARAHTAFQKLNGVRSLWINYLIPGSLYWVDKDHFEGKIEGPEEEVGNNEEDKILSGRITARDAEGRPTKIEYGWPAMKRKAEFWKEFIYSESVGNTKLPNIVVNGLKILALENPVSISTTNVLLDIEIGTEEAGPKGYVPDMFLATIGTNPTNPVILFESNNVVYRVGKNGLAPLPKPEDFIYQRPKWWGVTLVVLILLTPFIWISRKTFLRKGK